MSEMKSRVPGIIEEILFSVGDNVTKGQQVIIMEAMKMKMPIPAHESGTIKSISVNIGDRINPGALLFIIEP
ncbi:biotin [Chania multitudinisentens RB-25]|uniref:Biotin n=1 Tax=Chania multitudinisentens RB-25 TaxID=1441930 RepID=W0LJG7_9GAMM|nr:acetyl-CoA carboxylase biotin carboxyl carrier protein subunit [Chania multitudinisentens]AHG22472.1 biotin [Chania multitudinisentens RB-25]